MLEDATLHISGRRFYISNTIFVRRIYIYLCKNKSCFRVGCIYEFMIHKKLCVGGGFTYFLFSPLGRFPFWLIYYLIYFKGVVQPPTRKHFPCVLCVLYVVCVVETCTRCPSIFVRWRKQKISTNKLQRCSLGGNSNCVVETLSFSCNRCNIIQAMGTSIFT